MTKSVTQDLVKFEGVEENDIDAFNSEKDNILSAIHDRIRMDPRMNEISSDDCKARIALETARIFSENFYVCAKYKLPAALEEYLDWLRRYLKKREFPAMFLPRLIQAFQMSSHAFMEEPSNDIICRTLRDIKKRELDFARGDSASGN